MTRPVALLPSPLRLLCRVAMLFACVPAGPARAESFGVLVRYHAGEALPTTPVEVVLTADGGAPITLTLKDDGAQPDVTGGDGISAAATSVEGAVFAVTLRVDGNETALGNVSWDSVGARDLDIRRTDAGPVATASVSSPGAGPGDAKGPSPGPAGAAGAASAAEGAPGGALRAGVEATAGGLASAPAQVAAPKRDIEPRLVFGMAGGLVLLLVLLRLWVRGGTSEPSMPRGVTRVGPPGLFGPGTPAVSGTFALWTVDAEPPARAVAEAALIARVARDHRVLLVAPEGHPAPVVAGGPVHRAASTAPEAVAAAAVALAAEPGRPLAVVAMGLEPTAWAPLEDALPADLGGIGLVEASALPPDGDGGALPRVRMVPEGDGWGVTCGDARVRVRLESDGRAGALA
ncbi:MAG: hypothetical protein RLZZ299_1606 [Pseudomonadota bacterium]